MGGIKRLMEDEDAKYMEAVHIAIEAGTLEECEVHQGTYFSDSGDIGEAVELAREKFEKGEVSNFDDVEELVKKVVAVSEELGAEECFSCDFD
ncbi:hypothetical protein [Pseudomonas juntendi]|uniref:hypothetical protein n=1 Tax=Pseudomonas juntendi TaxID=2666183 RepID=UPI001F315832|nr:hypothetical protein [Pseudomonas juntendi]